MENLECENLIETIEAGDLNLNSSTRFTELLQTVSENMESLVELKVNKILGSSYYKRFKPLFKSLENLRTVHLQFSDQEDAEDALSLL